MLFHWFLHITGSDNVSGPWYGFWSGFGGDLPLFGGLVVFYRKHNCHSAKCWRLGIHHQPPYIYCKKHLKEQT